MPMAAKRPCRSIGCGVLVSSGYCEACAAKGKGRERRLNSTQRGYGSRWQKASKAWLRSHPLCSGYKTAHSNEVTCAHHERIVPAELVDHITPHRGDWKLFWDSTNWQPLCWSCHSVKTAHEDGGFGRVSQRGMGGEISDGIGR